MQMSVLAVMEARDTLTRLCESDCACQDRSAAAPVAISWPLSFPYHRLATANEQEEQGRRPGNGLLVARSVLVVFLDSSWLAPTSKRMDLVIRTELRFAMPSLTSASADPASGAQGQNSDMALLHSTSLNRAIQPSLSYPANI